MKLPLFVKRFLKKHNIYNVLFALIKKHKERKFYTKYCLQGKNFQIDDYTYGKPVIHFEDGAILKIGKFCSIAKDVHIFLGIFLRIKVVS
jgi:acetyltransferase-like isoleucine patch superfamily enzyme